MAKGIRFMAVAFSFFSGSVLMAAPGDPAPVTAAQVVTADPLAETDRLSEDLIYSVTRSPERTFDTARSVLVITAEDIRRRAGRGLADILADSAGIYVRRGLVSGGAAVVRGLAGNQVLILIDGMKLTNGTWGDEMGDYLNLVDISQIERVEIVRGVVSVLGTESLGGTINIIMKKGSPGGEKVTGLVGFRFSTADRSTSVPVAVMGQVGKLRYSAGMTSRDLNDLRGGEDVGKQAVSGYAERSGYASAQYLLSPNRTLSATYSDMEQSDLRVFAYGLIGPARYKPVHTQLGSLSYFDLTERPWADSFRVATSWNHQADGHVVEVVAPAVHADRTDTDTQFGFSVEAGKFLGATTHHLVYGMDLSTETTTSLSIETDRTTGAINTARSRTTPGARYDTFGFYVSDHFSIRERLTASIGARYGIFALKASESSFLGNFELDKRQGDYSASLNLIYHATPSLNLIGNAMRGFRTPNIYDATAMVWGVNTVQVPSAEVSTESVMSYELGAKYHSERFSGTAFYFRTDLHDLLVRAQGTLNGLPFYDSNGDGVHDSWEGSILQTRNVGKGTINGFELDGKLQLPRKFELAANVARTTGTNTASDEPFPYIPPVFGALKLRYLPVTRHDFWGEAVLNVAGAQDRISSAELADPALANGTPAYHAISIRGGASLTKRIEATLSLENLLDEEYRFHGSHVYEPGRQLIVATQFHF
jgi:hemoglobin/transferrin/lactoferrin receptor protein